MGQTLILVHDVRLAFDLLEKRSAKHSSRPKQVFAGEMYVDLCAYRGDADEFFIDYGSSRQMPSGPGSGATIQDYMQMGGHYDPPEGTSNLDPFTYDIFALGETIDDLFSVSLVVLFASFISH